MPADGEPGEKLFMLLDLQEASEYFVEAGGVRSALHRVEVADLPYVDQIALEYRFPAYTGLSPQRVEDGGDIAALRGTEVAVEVTSTVPVTKGRLMIEQAEGAPQPIDLAVDQEGRLAAVAPGRARHLLSRRASRSRRRLGHRLARLRDRGDGGPTAGAVVHQARARHSSAQARRGLHRGARRGRLRRRQARSRLLGQRRRREDDHAARRRQASEAVRRRSHLLSRRARPGRRRLHLVLRARLRSRSARARGDRDQRHLLRRDHAVLEELPPGGAGRQRDAGRPDGQRAVAAPAPDRRRDLQAGARSQGVRGQAVRREPEHGRADAGAAARAGRDLDRAHAEPAARRGGVPAASPKTWSPPSPR